MYLKILNTNMHGSSHRIHLFDEYGENTKGLDLREKTNTVVVELAYLIGVMCMVVIPDPYIKGLLFVKCFGSIRGVCVEPLDRTVHF